MPASTSAVDGGVLVKRIVDVERRVKMSFYLVLAMNIIDLEVENKRRRRRITYTPHARSLRSTCFE
jgi:hypothetical protein